MDPAAAVAAEPPPPGRPQRQLDTASLEGLDDLVDPDSPDRGLVKSRDFPELYGLEVQPSDVSVVLFDANSLDSFVACAVARFALGEGARYEGVDRSKAVYDLEVEVTGRVVAMLGVCWSTEAMHDLVAECDWLLILETHVSVLRDLEQFTYPSAVRILDCEMAACVLAYNFFYPGMPVPPLLRALEDAELGRSALRGASAFADGLQCTPLDLEIPRGELLSGDAAFEVCVFLLDNGGRTTITCAIDEGMALAAGIEEQCREASQRRSVRTLRAFPAWRCALANVSSPFAGRVAESLAKGLVAEGGDLAAERCFAAAFEIRWRRVRVTLRSLPGGPDVSEVAQQYDGCGRPGRAFFSVPFDSWAELWLQPEPVLWDTVPVGPRCLALRRGEAVTVLRRGERFKDAPFDEWSWGYRTDDSRGTEGWIPTLAHTVFVAVHSEPAAVAGVSPVDEGDLLVAKGQRGEYLWGLNHRSGRTGSGVKGWFPHTNETWQPVHSVSAWDFLSAEMGLA